MRIDNEKLMGREHIPGIMQLNMAKPIPMGAMKVSRDFSCASMRMTKTSSAVNSISMTSPWPVVVPPERVVLACQTGIGNSARAIAAATILPSSCVGTRMAARTQGTWPVMARPRVTCQDGLFSRVKGQERRVLILEAVTYSWVEQSAADAVKGPHVDEKRDGVSKTDDQHSLVAHG
jgi:hypothetical protein